MNEELAGLVIAALDRALAHPPLLDGKSAEEIHRWLAKFPNFRAGALDRLMERLEARRAAPKVANEHSPGYD
jgi:hypothetical protein